MLFVLSGWAWSIDLAVQGNGSACPCSFLKMCDTSSSLSPPKKQIHRHLGHYSIFPCVCVYVGESSQPYPQNLHLSSLRRIDFCEQ